MHTLIKELAIRRVEHRSALHSNEFQHLAEGTEVTRLRRRFSFVSQKALLFRTRHHLCRQAVALAGIRQLPWPGPTSVYARCTERVTRSGRREGANGDRDRDGNGDGDGDRVEIGTGEEVK